MSEGTIHLHPFVPSVPLALALIVSGSGNGPSVRVPGWQEEGIQADI